MATCTCSCHRDSCVIPYVGVDTDNAIEAVIACWACQPLHDINPLPPTAFQLGIDELPPWTPDEGEGSE